MKETTAAQAFLEERAAAIAVPGSYLPCKESYGNHADSHLSAWSASGFLMDFTASRNASRRSRAMSDRARRTGSTAMSLQMSQQRPLLTGQAL